MLALLETGRPPRIRTEFPGLKDRCIGHECLQPIWRPGPTPRRPPLAPICAPYPTASPEDAETGHARWSRTTCLPVCSRPSALRTVSSCVIWRPQRGSNPHSQIDNLVSWPLDDESSWWTWPDSNRLLPRARRMPCRWTTGPVVAGVGLAPTCMAYETRLELPPANPRWLQRQDSNLHMAAYETALEPFQARCSAGGVVGI